MFDTEKDIKRKVLEGLDASCKKLIQSKKERNSDVIISENGKIVRIKAQDVKYE